MQTLCIESLFKTQLRCPFPEEPVVSGRIYSPLFASTRSCWSKINFTLVKITLNATTGPKGSNIELENDQRPPFQKQLYLLRTAICISTISAPVRTLT